MKLRDIYLLIASVTLLLNTAVVVKLISYLGKDKIADAGQEQIRVFRIAGKREDKQAATITLSVEEAALSRAADIGEGKDE